MLEGQCQVLFFCFLLFWCVPLADGRVVLGGGCVVLGGDRVVLGGGRSCEDCNAGDTYDEGVLLDDAELGGFTASFNCNKRLLLALIAAFAIRAFLACR